MIKIQDLCIESNQNILACMELLDKNAQGIVFVVDRGRLLGSISDGDIRRAIISGANNNDCIAKYSNKEVVALQVGVSEEEIQKKLSKDIKIIPLLDGKGVVVDYASIFRLRSFPVMEPLLGGNELEYVTDCIKTNWISSQGKYVLKFEEMLQKQCNVDYCLATSNGTVSLHLALVSLNIGIGDEVIVPNLTFGASVNSIIHSGATPVLIDVDLDSWNISPELIRAAITPKTKAIMPVHIYGNPCDMVGIMEIAKKFNLFVIEDCAEALGATINGQPVGSFGHAAAFSFFANKVITCGEGGALVLRDKKVYEKASLMRDHGMLKGKRYWHVDIGYNYRLTNLQAAIGCAQLEQLSDFRKRRINIFKLYDQYLLSSSYFIKQQISIESESSYWLYSLCIKDGVEVDRDTLMKRLALLGIETRPLFYPMNLMPAFKNVVKSLSLDNSELISSQGLSLPTSVILTNIEIQSICKEILYIMKGLLKNNKAKY
jgi:perosamine synthetase